MSLEMERRSFVIGSAMFGAALSFPAMLNATEIEVEQLKPGQWLWYPERAPEGPVVVLVSLSDQLAFVYRNGVRIGVTTVSSGKSGYGTPVGVFTVLTKEKLHRSHKYNNAPMPDSQFFFGGCALHAGGLPGYPSSHGCVHLPRDFADRLFQVTHHGTPVIVTNERSGVGSLSHTGLVLSETDLKQVEQMTGNIVGKGLPTDKKGANSDSFSVLVSGADSKLYALLNGKLVREDPIAIKDSRWPLGSHAYVLKGHNAATNSYDWLAIGLGSGHESKVDQQKELAVTTRLKLSNDTYNFIAKHIHPGSTLFLTDLAAHPSTRSGVDFAILRDDGSFK